MLLGNNGPPHNREDDLESFYYVVNWMALRYTSHSLDSPTLTSELQRIFDYSYRLPGGTAAGGGAKCDALLSGGTNRQAKFQSLPIAKLLEAIRKLVAVRYSDKPDSEAEQVDIDRYKRLVNRLSQRHQFTSLFTKALTSDQDWDANGAKVDHKLQIYLRSHAKKVRNIAQLKEGADASTHKTITHEAAEMLPSKSFPKIRRFRHYRLALDDNGRDLRAFSSVKEFVNAIHDATKGKLIYKLERTGFLTNNHVAHDDAFFEAGILHQDISVGNIVILNNGTGLLIDWDLCKIMNTESENEEHAAERTVSKHRYLDTKSDFEKGTWQFAAARLLLGNNVPPQNREDDLESFYHVLNWMALRYTSHSLKSQTLTGELQRIFDYSYRLPGGTAAGGRAKRAELSSGGTNMEAEFQNLLLAELLEAIRKLVAVRYNGKPDSEAEQVDIDRYHSLVNRLSQRHEFTSLFTKALTSDQDWDANGAKVDHKLVD